MTTTKFHLPKKYLSYSAISQWLHYKDQFRKRYYEGAESPTTPELTFGKKVAELLEHGHASVSHILQYPTPEQNISTEIDGVPIFGFIDSFDPERLKFLEYKTGKQPWDDKRVAGHLQLDIYSLCIENIFGKVDDTCHLIWMETEKIEQPTGGLITHASSYGLRLTGRVETFERTITKEERDRTRALIVRVAHEISEDYLMWQERKRKETPRKGASIGGLR